jgi:hypothetical protein
LVLDLPNALTKLMKQRLTRHVTQHAVSVRLARHLFFQLS